MDLLILLLSTLFIFLIVILYKNSKTSSKKVYPPPPGPPGIPLIGNLHEFYNSAPHKYLWQLSKKYGPLMSLKLGFLPVLVVSSARLAENVMKSHDLIFCSRPPMAGQLKLSYNGLDIALAPYNEGWRGMRKISVVHLLNAKRVNSFRPIREDEVYRMVRKISNQAGSFQVTNLSETALSFTNTIICRIAFGKRYDEEDHESRRFNDLIHEAQAVVAAFYFSNFFPKMRWLDYFAGTFSRLDKIFHKLDLLYQELIDEHMDPNRPKSMDGDIIDLMLQLRQGNSTSFDITLDHIKGMLMNLFVAGSDTSGATIIWAMTALMKSPAKMKKAQAEIRELIAKQNTIDEDDVEKLPYLKAVVKETLRLYPPAPLLVPRYTMENCIIDGYQIRPGTLVHVNAWAIARDPDYWENPDEFLPERFLDGNINVKGLEFHYIPFGGGRRVCPGYPLALRVVELALANLLHSFDWELPPGMKKEDIDTDVLPGISMLKKNDLQLLAKNYV